MLESERDILDAGHVRVFETWRDLRVLEARPHGSGPAWADPGSESKQKIQSRASLSHDTRLRKMFVKGDLTTKCPGSSESHWLCSPAYFMIIVFLPVMNWAQPDCRRKWRSEVRFDEKVSSAKLLHLRTHRHQRLVFFLTIPRMLVWDGTEKHVSARVLQ